MRDDRAVTPDPIALQPDRALDLHEAGDRLRELAFLHDIAQLATLARDWDELMRTIVEGTTAALGVEVCSFYLADRDGRRLTLEGTNGLDSSQVGKVSLAWGEGVTGRVAESRRPIAIEDVTRDDRFSWVRGFDVEALAGMLSVPLDLARRGGGRAQRPDPRGPALRPRMRSSSCGRSRRCSRASSRRAD